MSSDEDAATVELVVLFSSLYVHRWVSDSLWLALADVPTTVTPQLTM